MAIKLKKVQRSNLQNKVLVYAHTRKAGMTPVGGSGFRVPRKY